ncbi:hypothetical protein Hdeb2414_s0023g00630171 [Helianthus debilis subsp. tardiflorus]
MRSFILVLSLPQIQIQMNHFKFLFHFSSLSLTQIQMQMKIPFSVSNVCSGVVDSQWFCGGGAIMVILLWCVFHPPPVTCRR